MNRPVLIYILNVGENWHEMIGCMPWISRESAKLYKQNTKKRKIDC